MRKLSIERADQPTGSQFPKAHHAFAVTGGEVNAVGRESDIRDPLAMPSEGSDQVAARHIPQGNCFSVGHGEPSAITLREDDPGYAALLTNDWYRRNRTGRLC